MTRFAIFGAGLIGTIHARNIAAHADFTLLHVVDQDIERAKALADRVGGVASDSPKKALNDEAVDAVIIGSSTSAHEEHVLACAKAGKAFLCEKPLSDSLSGSIACVAAASDAGVISAMGLNRRLDPDLRVIADKIRAGAIGPVETVHFTSRGLAPPVPESVPFSGGMIREKGAHFYDLAYWLTASEPIEVFASGACLIDPRLAEYGDVDTAALIIRFENKALATFQFGRRSGFGHDELVEVCGAEGMLRGGRKLSGSVELHRGQEIIGMGIDTDSYKQFGASYVDELNVFARAVAGQGPVHASLVDGLRAQAVAEAALVSIAQSKAVPITRVW